VLKGRAAGSAVARNGRVWNVHHGLCRLTFALESRYTTLVWRFLPEAVESNVRREFSGLNDPRHGSFRLSYFGLHVRTGRAGAALEGLCTRLFVPVVSSIESPQAT
jgi:hypothetical protein